LIFLDSNDFLFEQENDIEFLTKNMDQQTPTGQIHRRVNAIFGDTESDDRYYQPQKIIDDTLMDVSFIF
jgi:hypothetical protein